MPSSLHAAPRRPFRRLLMQCLGILLVAVAAGVIFNLTMPQGVGWLPREISQPLWRPVDMQEAYRLYQSGARFVDARDPGDYLHARVRGAISLPPEEFERYYPLLKDMLASSEVIVVYGKTFSRFPAARIAQRLAEMGHAKVMAAELCLGKWEQAGYPLKQPKGRRQQQ